MKTQNRLLKLFLFIFLSTLFTAAYSDEIKWAGCGISKKAYISELSKAFEKKSGHKIIIEGGGATKGIRLVKTGSADVGGSCRHLLDVPEEKNVKLNPVGWDAVVAITNPSNPVKDISQENLKKIFLGKISNWSALGGTDAPIKLVVRKGKISGVGRTIRELLFKNPNQDFASSAVVKKSSGPVEKMVEKESNAIAFTGISSARKRNVHILKIDGVEPTYDNIAEGKFPLFRPLYLVVGKNTPKAALDFVKFAQSADGQNIIKSQKTITLQDGKNLWAMYRKTMKEARQVGNF